jgi:tetratricopeptide (TPR) repeat protein
MDSAHLLWFTGFLRAQCPLQPSPPGKGLGLLRLAIISLYLSLPLAASPLSAQTTDPLGPSDASPTAPAAQTKTELQAGTDLTRQGFLQNAIPHLLAAQRAGADPYATAVNLGICYLGLGRYQEAIAVLAALRSSGYDTVVIDNLLSQAYLGVGRPKTAMDEFLRAAALTPKDEKLYAFIADACTDHHDYDMGLRIVEIGLQQLSDSARLHYERALFLGRLDRLEEARPEFDRAAQLAPGSYIADLARVQLALYDDKFADAIDLLHQAINAGRRDYQTLSLLGTVLMQAGAAPGDAQFVEARQALEESARAHPDYSATQLGLGKLYLMEDRFAEAANHLERARRLEPENPAVYTNLAQAYRRLGEPEKARQLQAQLAQLLAGKKPVQPAR